MILGMAEGPKRRARRAVLLDLFGIALVTLEVRRGGIEEQHIDLEVQQIGGRPVHLLGQLRLDLQQPVHRPIQRLRILTDRTRGQPVKTRHQTPATHNTPASRTEPAPDWRPSRTTTARPADRACARPAAARSSHRSPTAATTRQAPTPHRAAPTARTQAPPARSRSTPAQAPKPVRATAPTSPAPPGQADPHDRGYGSPSRPSTSAADPTRCAPTAHSEPPSRPCSAAQSCAGTCLAIYQPAQTDRGKTADTFTYETQPVRADNPSKQAKISRSTRLNTPGTVELGLERHPDSAAAGGRPVNCVGG